LVAAELANQVQGGRTLLETPSFTRARFFVRLQSEQSSKGRLAADLVGWSAGIVEQHG
jgi:hypothetical protein